MLQPWKTSTKLKCFVLALSLVAMPLTVQRQFKDPAGSLLEFISNFTSKEVVVEVVEDVAQPETETAVAAVPDLQPAPRPILGSIPEILPDGRMRVAFNTAMSFDQVNKVLASNDAMSYAQAETPQTKTAALPPLTVQQPEPKKVAAPIPKKKNEWNEMTGFERRRFVVRFVISNHLDCPPSGKTEAAEAKELADHGWAAVRAGIWWFCSAKK